MLATPSFAGTADDPMSACPDKPRNRTSRLSSSAAHISAPQLGAKSGLRSRRLTNPLWRRSAARGRRSKASRAPLGDSRSGEGRRLGPPAPCPNHRLTTPLSHPARCPEWARPEHTREFRAQHWPCTTNNSCHSRCTCLMPRAPATTKVGRPRRGRRASAGTMHPACRPHRREGPQRRSPQRRWGPRGGRIPRAQIRRTT